MIRSMTGYGKGECCLYNRRVTVEIKSVNHRYNDITIKIPRSLGMFEDKIRKIIASDVYRGKTDVYVLFETLSRDDIKITLNEPIADAYVAELRKLKERHSFADEPSLSMMSRLPDMFSVEKNLENEKTMTEIWETFQGAVSEALGNFIQMRKIEGKALLADIVKKLSKIEILVENVNNRAPVVTAEYSRRIKERLSEMLAEIDIDENRIITESAIFADKACVDEELIRLKSHINQLRETLDASESVGRKLDFIVQEMNREVNTISSKSNDTEITKLAVELKSEIEKIREQLQNVE